MTRMCSANWKCILSSLCEGGGAGGSTLSFGERQLVQEFSQIGMLNYQAATVRQASV